MASAFERIGTEVSGLASSSTYGPGGAGGGTEMGAHFETIESGMVEMRDLVERGRQLSEQTRVAAKNSSSASGLLMAHIDQVVEISVDMQLQALNAIIKSARLGELGRTLQVLSHEVSLVSEASSEFVAGVVSLLESIKGSADRLDRMAQAGEVDTASGGAMEVASGEARQACDAFRELTLSVREKSQGMGDAVSFARDNLQFFTRLLSALQDSASEVDALIEELRPEAEMGAGHEIDGGRLADRYTMASEREIHESVWGSGQPSPGFGASTADGRNMTKAPAAVGVAEGNEDGFDDNVELF